MADHEVRYSVDVHDVTDELDRLISLPGLHTVLDLESELVGLFQDTQQHVHIITGALKASGQVRSYAIHEGTWSGEISYGGDGVDYAWFEQRRGLNEETGRDHNFMRDVEESDFQFEVVVYDAIAGDE